MKNPANITSSISEDNGIAALSDDDLQIYSVGVSTGGLAEIRMARLDPKRHIIATTIDQSGINFAHKLIQEQKLENQIQLSSKTFPPRYPTTPTTSTMFTPGSYSTTWEKSRFNTLYGNSTESLNPAVNYLSLYVQPNVQMPTAKAQPTILLQNSPHAATQIRRLAKNTPIRDISIPKNPFRNTSLKPASLSSM
jgi:hypothetical protein